MESGRWEYFARCAGGFEPVLARELRTLGLRQVRPLKGGVAFAGGIDAAYRACLWTRCATRIQLVLARVDARDADELYDGVRSFPWEEHVRPRVTIAVHAHGENPALRNTHFTALKVKDAMCDRLLERRGSRPDVDVHDPGFAVDVALHRDRATLYLNLSGESLHRRGYRKPGQQVLAPLKETLAAGILLAAGWDETCRQEGAAFVDPMCGSGTFAIEAALIAADIAPGLADIAPGLARGRWGFDGWALHDAGCWQAEREAANARAEERAAEGRARKRAGTGKPVRIVAGDSDPRAVKIARADAARARVAGLVEFHVCDAAGLADELGAPAGGPLAPAGLMAVNPPYGERLLDGRALPGVYRALERAVSSLASSWRLAVITPDTGIDAALGLLPDEVIPCHNGPLGATLRLYEVDLGRRNTLDLISVSGEPRAVNVLEAGSGQFAARLRKVAKERLKWARREHVSCCRIYDADLPDYSLSIDLYEGAGDDEGERFLRIVEYQAPSTVDAERAARRFSDACAIAPAILDVPARHVFGKVRRHAKGGGQYREARGEPFVVCTQEAGYRLEVDLDGHLDTGIFLDHRPTRALVGRLAAGTRFLNLFAYTGTASVHAAGGGARATMTVDLSQAYLDWAGRNMRANGFCGARHRFERADAMRWLEWGAQRPERYDLVFCDPPTFSNSKSRGAGTFDVQRDHGELLARVAAVLAPGGLIVFSCNLRRFKLDGQALAAAGLVARDITARTIPHDFARTPKVHRCFLVAAGEEALDRAEEMIR